MPKQMNVRTGGDLGRAIAEIRADRNLSARDTAEAAGLSSGYLAQIESGRTTRLLEHQLRTLRRLGATITVEFPGQTPSQQQQPDAAHTPAPDQTATDSQDSDSPAPNNTTPRLKPGVSHPAPHSDD